MPCMGAGKGRKAWFDHVLLAGDGFKAGASKEVRIGVTILTTTGLNQSPYDWSEFCLYSGDESWASIKAFLEPVPDKIIEFNSTGLVYDNVNDGQTYCVKLSLGGDMPWLLAMLGKCNMNFTEGLSSYCLYAIPSMIEFFLKDHTLFTADIAAMLTHTFPGSAVHNLPHQSFQCPAVA
eukprot:1339561-Pleurochrysis_carterae.AAC.1